MDLEYGFFDLDFIKFNVGNADSQIYVLYTRWIGMEK